MSLTLESQQSNLLKDAMISLKIIRARIESLQLLFMILIEQGQLNKALLTLNAIKFYFKQEKELLECDNLAHKLQVHKSLDPDPLLEQKEETTENPALQINQDNLEQEVQISLGDNQADYSLKQLSSEHLYNSLVLNLENTQKYFRYAYIVVSYLQEDYSKALSYIKKFEECYPELINDKTVNKSQKQADLKPKSTHETGANLTQSSLFNFDVNTFNFIKKKCEYMQALLD